MKKLWYCPTCNQVGIIALNDNTYFMLEVNAIGNSHLSISPLCLARLTRIPTIEVASIISKEDLRLKVPEWAVIPASKLISFELKKREVLKRKTD